MKTCWLCPKRLEGDNLTGEHVIPSAIGGRKEVFSFICRYCNGTRGAAWEAELAKQFLWFSSAAGVKRGRGGKHPDFKVQTASGEKLKLHNDSVLALDGHDVSVENLGDRIYARIRTSDAKTIKNLLKKIASENPEFDFENAKITKDSIDGYLDEPLTMSVHYGGPAGGRSMVKSSLALISELHVDKTVCGRALAYLLDPLPEAPQPYCFFFGADLIINRPEDHLFHCVSVIGQPEEGRILGYVEFFNFARILIHIGDGYSGDAFQVTYAIDPVKGKELELSVDFGLIKGSLEVLFQMPSKPPQMYIDSLEYAISIVNSLNDDRVRHMAISKASREALRELGLSSSTEEVPLALKDEWIRLFLKGLVPYIEAKFKKDR